MLQRCGEKKVYSLLSASVMLVFVVVTVNGGIYISSLPLLFKNDYLVLQD